MSKINSTVFETIKEIDIEDVDLTKFILSKFGQHNQSDVDKTLTKKTHDLTLKDKNGISRCFWALSGMTIKNTRSFCDEYCKKARKIFALLPYTTSASNKNSPEKPFKGWIDTNGVTQPFPTDMKDVTGGDRSNKALVFKNLYRLRGKFIDDTNNHPLYENLFSCCETFLDGGIIGKPHLRISNVCMQLKSGITQFDAVKSFKDNEDKNGKLVFLVAELEEPYFVDLYR